MENQSYDEYFSSNDTYTEVPLFSSYLNMAFRLLMAIVVITPAVMVINVIWQIRELHTKYYFFVANLLATDVAFVIVRSAMECLIIILYLLGLNSDPATAIVQFLVFPVYMIFRLMNILLPITIAMERMIVIGFPYRHRSIMTKKTVIGILAAMWGVSLILAIMVTVIVPVDVVWPLATVNTHITAFPFFAVPRLTSAVCIIAANVFLYYQVTISNRKAKENERLGNEDEVKRFQKLIQLLRTQAKPTITLLLVGGIDVIGQVLITITYATIGISVDPSTFFYLKHFLMYPLDMSLLASHPLVYGLYMKKIRRRLPNCVAYCQMQCNTRRSRVITLHQHPTLSGN